MEKPVEKQIEPLLNVDDVAKMLSVSKSAAYRLMREEITVVRFGPGAVRVRESDLQKYILSKIVPH